MEIIVFIEIAAIIFVFGIFGFWAMRKIENHYRERETSVEYAWKKDLMIRGGREVRMISQSTIKEINDALMKDVGTFKKMIEEL